MHQDRSIDQQNAILADDLVSPAWVIREYPQFSARTIYRHLDNEPSVRIAGSREKFYHRLTVKEYFNKQRKAVYGG